MKVLHVSDLHIGKRVNGMSMLDDQRYILRQILDIAEKRQVSVLLIAGDVYDKASPSAEAVTVFDAFLTDAVAAGLRVLAIPGNHDSAERIAYAQGLLEKQGVCLPPVYAGEVERVELEDEHGPVEFWLLPFLKPGDVRRFFPDEEIGEGASLFDVPGFGAAYAYTVDGEDVGEISYENFNAAAAVVTVHGFSVHPGSAKDTMINAQNVAMEFHAALPAFSRPEHTEGREGFFHLTSMQGDVTTAHLGYIVRDHDAAKFAARKAQLQHIADCLNGRYGAGTVELDIKDSYYNMLEKIQPHFHLVENARKAIRAAGLDPIESPVRGGTDGATLSYMGLPCPNLGTGGFNFHGPCECITAEKMDQGVEILLNLVDLYK